MSPKSIARTTPLRIHAEPVIAGAGIAGLSVALALAAKGIRTKILELRSELEARMEGAFVTLAPNGVNALRAIGLADAVEAAGIVTKAIVLHNEAGRPIGRLDFADHRRTYGAPTVTIGRGALASLLLDAARRADVEVRFQSPITALSQNSDEVVLWSGSERLAAEALIAADGIRSAVRQMAFPHAPLPRYSGAIGTGGILNLPSIAPTGGELWMTFGRKAFFGYLKEHSGLVYWFDSHQAKDPSPPAFDPHEYARLIARLHARDPLQNAAITDAIDGLEGLYPLYDLDSFTPWSTHRIALIGDAAHAVTPHSGLGASLAIEDGIILASLVSKLRDWNLSFVRFERLRHERTDRALKLGRRSGGQKAPSGWLARKSRDLLLPWLIPVLGREQSAQYAFRADLHSLERPA